jgi:hypothetical protein
MICCEPGCDCHVYARNRCRCHYDKWYRVQLTSTDNPTALPPSARNQRYRERHPDRVRNSTTQYCQSQKGRAARTRANQRSNRWQATIRFLNRATAQEIKSKFPCLQPSEVQAILQQRPVTAKAIRELLSAQTLSRVRQFALTDWVENGPTNDRRSLQPMPHGSLDHMTPTLG